MKILLFSAIWLLALVTLGLIPLTISHCSSRKKIHPYIAPSRPIILTVCIIATMVGYYLSGKFVEIHASTDFLGFDIGKAFFWSSLPASSIGLSTGLLSIRRFEQFRPLAIGVCLFTALWFASSLMMSVRALPFLLDPLYNSERNENGSTVGAAIYENAPIRNPNPAITIGLR